MSESSGEGRHSRVVSDAAGDTGLSLMAPMLSAAGVADTMKNDRFADVARKLRQLGRDFRVAGAGGRFHGVGFPSQSISVGLIASAQTW